MQNNLWMVFEIVYQHEKEVYDMSSFTHLQFNRVWLVLQTPVYIVGKLLDVLYEMNIVDWILLTSNCVYCTSLDFCFFETAFGGSLW